MKRVQVVKSFKKKLLCVAVAAALGGSVVESYAVIPGDFADMARYSLPTGKPTADVWVKLNHAIRNAVHFEEFDREYLKRIDQLTVDDTQKDQMRSQLKEMRDQVEHVKAQMQTFALIGVEFEKLDLSADAGKKARQAALVAKLELPPQPMSLDDDVYIEEVVGQLITKLSDEEMKEFFSLFPDSSDAIKTDIPDLVKVANETFAELKGLKNKYPDVWSSMFDSGRRGRSTFFAAPLPGQDQSIRMLDTAAKELKPGTDSVAAVDMSKIDLSKTPKQGLSSLVTVKKVQGKDDVLAKGITLSNFTGSKSDIEKLQELQNYAVDSQNNNSEALAVNTASSTIGFGGSRLEFSNSSNNKESSSVTEGKKVPQRLGLIYPLGMVTLKDDGTDIKDMHLLPATDGHVVVKDKSDITAGMLMGTTVTVSEGSVLRANEATVAGTFSFDGTVTGFDEDAVDLEKEQRKTKSDEWNARYNEPVILGFMESEDTQGSTQDSTVGNWLYVDSQGKPVIEEGGKFYQAKLGDDGKYFLREKAKKKDKDGVEQDVLIEVKDPVRIQRVIRIGDKADVRVALDNSVKDKLVVDGKLVVHQDKADRKDTGRFVEITLNKTGEFITQVDLSSGGGLESATYTGHKVILDSKKDFKAVSADGKKEGFVNIDLVKNIAVDASGKSIDNPKVVKSLAENGFDSELRIGVDQTAFVDVNGLLPSEADNSGSLVVVEGTLIGVVRDFKELKVAKGARLLGDIGDGNDAPTDLQPRVIFKGGTYEGGTLDVDAQLDSGAVLTLKPATWPEKLADAAYYNTASADKGKAVPFILTKTLDGSEGTLVLVQPGGGIAGDTADNKKAVLTVDHSGDSKGMLKLGSRLVLAIADTERPFISLRGDDLGKMVEGVGDVNIVADVGIDKQKLADAKKDKKQKGVSLTAVQAALLKPNKDGKYAEQKFLFAESMDADFSDGDDAASIEGHSVLFDTTISRGDKVDDKKYSVRQLAGTIKRTDNVNANLVKNGATPLGAGILAAHLKNVGHNISGNMLPLKDANVLNAVQTAADEGKLKKLGSELTPHVAASGALPKVSRNLLAGVHRSVDQHRHGQNDMVATGDTFESQGFWGQYIHNDGSQNNKDDISGFSSKVDGITLGLDAEVNEQLTVGFAFTYAKSDIKTKDDVSQSTKGDHYMGTFYAGWNDGPWFMDGMLSYAAGKNDYKSAVTEDNAGSSVARSYKGKGDTSTWGVTFGGGYNLPMSDEWTLQPKAEFNFYNVKVDDYKLENSGGAFEQQIKTEDVQITELGAGVRVMGDIAMEQGNLKPEFRLMGYYDFNNKKYEGEVKSLSLGGVGKFVGMKREQGRALAGLGVVYAMDENLSLGLNYDYNFSGGFKDHSIMAKVSYSF
ncbi:autotransporter outer membrane beta-barrel domain-containing protein [Endozoicomonas sp. Mp262]|uniref:autotransporter outer membrane beta-barrel domain-containing protein n=1 Tax=Endozoicomonas sp. Mp262 TaxID=2919499 RepID=UPI0021D8BCCC